MPPFLTEGTTWDTGLGEVVADGCSSTGDVLAGRADRDEEGDHPNKMW